jgi:hypothetical protein
VRSLTFAFLLLLSWVSTIQAVHIHGQWLPNNAAMAGAPADASQVPGGEEHCPLCVAMHSTLPVSSGVQPLRLVVVDCHPLQGAGRVHEAQRHFAMFSRPPPAVENV